MAPRAEFQQPALRPWMRNALIGAFALYALELIARNAGVDVYALAWHPFGAGFQPWQPLTRFAVQGPGVTGVLFGLLLVYFLLPAVWDTVGRDILGRAAAAAVAGATALPMLLDLAIADRGQVLGWTALAWVLLPTVFGLALPQQTVYLFFVIPVNGRFLVVMTGVLSGLWLLLGAGGAIETGEPFGAFAGTLGWWFGLGPGARRRELKQKARSIEAELRRFTVIEGGRAQEGQRKPDDDEWVH